MRRGTRNSGNGRNTQGRGGGYRTLTRAQMRKIEETNKSENKGSAKKQSSTKENPNQSGH